MGGRSKQKWQLVVDIIIRGWEEDRERVTSHKENIQTDNAVPFVEQMRHAKSLSRVCYQG